MGEVKLKNVQNNKRKDIKTIKGIMGWIIRHFHIILYFLGFLLGITLIWLSFSLTGNWITVTSGVGTGLLTSLVVSIAINYANDKRQEMKLLEDKKVVLGDIIETTIDVYEDVVSRINEYVMFSNSPPNSLYSFYNDFSPYNKFADYLKKLDIDKLSESEQSHLEKLFNIGNYRIDHLVAELKQFPKHDYYLRGLLTEDEFNKLTSNTANNQYMNYAEHINDFWNDGIINYEKCIFFLRLTLRICSKIIESIQYCQADVIKKEENIKNRLSERYYYEVYSLSDEYIEEQQEKQQARDEYYANHPDEYHEEMEETEEDILLKPLYYAICGWSADSVNDVLDSLDRQNVNRETVLLFLARDDVQASLKKSWKKRRVIKKKFGKDYLQKAKKLNENNTNG